MMMMIMVMMYCCIVKNLFSCTCIPWIHVYVYKVHIGTVVIVDVTIVIINTTAVDGNRQPVGMQWECWMGPFARHKSSNLPGGGGEW